MSILSVWVCAMPSDKEGNVKSAEHESWMQTIQYKPTFTFTRYDVFLYFSSTSPLPSASPLRFPCLISIPLYKCVSAASSVTPSAKWQWQPTLPVTSETTPLCSARSPSPHPPTTPLSTNWTSSRPSQLADSTDSPCPSSPSRRTQDSSEHLELRWGRYLFVL